MTALPATRAPVTSPCSRGRRCTAAQWVRTMPQSSVPPQWQATTHDPGNLRRHLHWSPRRPADGQQRAGLRERVVGRGPGVYSAPVVACSLRRQGGLISRCHFSSPPVPPTRPPIGTGRWSSAPQKDQSGNAADWRPPKSGDQEDDGRSPSDKDPTQRHELNGTMVSRYSGKATQPT